MAIGLVVKKCGMSRLFNDDGRSYFGDNIGGESNICLPN